MNNKTPSYRSTCPINTTQELLGDKWSLLVVRDIMFMGKKYYGEFLNSPEKISTNILADRLVKLEDAGVITKTTDKDNLSKYIYTLTTKGIDLMPMLFEMIAWGDKYITPSKLPKEFLRRLKSDKENLLREFMKKLKSHKGDEGVI